MAIIETCLVDYNGEHGWGIISEGVLCPTISLCMSEGVAGGLAEHGYPGHTVRRWADENHSHDATRHKVPPWSRIKWPPSSGQDLPPTVKEEAPVRFPPASETTFGTPSVGEPGVRIDTLPPPPAKLVKVILAGSQGETQIGDLPPAVQVGDPPLRKSLLVRRPLVTVNSPPPRVEAEFKEYPREPVKTAPAQVGVFESTGPMQTLNLKPPDPIPAPADTLNHGVLVDKAAPVAADTAADNSRVYGRPLTLAEKLAARKAGLL